MLGTVGAGAGVGTILASASTGRSESGDGCDSSPTRLPERAFETLGGVAEVVYPSTVTATPAIVKSYTLRLDDSRIVRLEATLDELNDHARSTLRDDFATVPVDTRNALLRELGVDAAQPAPHGIFAARVRYYVVNGLLYALFTRPEGGRLVGIDNPVGYPGGYYGSDQYGGDE